MKLTTSIGHLLILLKRSATSSYRTKLLIALMMQTIPYELDGETTEVEFAPHAFFHFQPQPSSSIIIYSSNVAKRILFPCRRIQ